jgi:crotonobetainyl-CoA:carnitine CoA-transferase CaiB-like acyl-CoA transferase
VVDIVGGAHLAQGILAALYQQSINSEAVLVEVKMFDSILDFHFEVFTCFLNDGNQLPERSAVNSGHAYVAAPYGIYKTADGFMTLAMGNIIQLAGLLGCEALNTFTDSAEWFTKRDEIKSILVDHLLTQTTTYWLAILQPADIWCAPVFNYDDLMHEEGYKVLNMEMEVKTGKGFKVKTTRCPIQVDGEYLLSAIGAPMLGEHNSIIDKQYQLQ